MKLPLPFHTGYDLLAASDEHLAQAHPQTFGRAWIHLLGVSLGMGLLAMGIWALAWRVFGEIVGLRVMPTAILMSVWLLGPYRLAALSLGQLLSRRCPTSLPLTCATLVALMALALLGLERYDYRYNAPLPTWIAWIRPYEKLYGVLLLMPLWGAWSMLITSQLCRPGQGDRSAALLRSSCGPLRAALAMGALLAMTITYFNFLPWEQLGISIATVSAAVGSGAVFCRLEGGLTRRAMLAANWVTQMTFLLAYQAGSNLLKW